jgi:hypothetical protein
MEPQLIQREKFPAIVPVLFRVTVTVTVCPTVAEMVDGETDVITMFALPLVMVTDTDCEMPALAPITVIV